MTKISALFCILLAFFSGMTFACPPECNCLETEITCTNLNTLPDASDLFTHPNQVETVSITDSASVTEIPENFFSDLPMLTTLNLSSNQLATFNMESLAYATSLRTIDLTNNPIVCDKNIDWLRKWETYPPGKRVSGTCRVSGKDINTYLSDKPANLVAVKFYNSTVTLDRACSKVTLPFVIVGNFTSDLEYRAFIEVSPSSAEVHVVNENISVPVGTNSSSVIIAVTNRGETRDNVETLVQVYTKYPVSYEAQVEVRLRNGVSGCVAPDPVVVDTSPTSAVTQGVTTEPSVTHTQDDTNTTPPKVSTEPTTASEPETTSESEHSSNLVIAFIVLAAFLVVVAILVAFRYFRKKCNKPNKTAGDNTV
ncbi:Leucine-rich repeat-containing protein 3 [Holothuria leucospilota]|uniref:Leucine-rich repeat-containing protein 3 n=1 Tax=Holothuria leucospilota TaxID=206669 RepID=A0A9Q1HLZ2_HOLLE|nr:Leucine-rich repeat-containing protein 3 [Holothuria leucospilota]